MQYVLLTIQIQKWVVQKSQIDFRFVISSFGGDFVSGVFSVFFDAVDFWVFVSRSDDSTPARSPIRGFRFLRRFLRFPLFRRFVF